MPIDNTPRNDLTQSPYAEMMTITVYWRFDRQNDYATGEITIYTAVLAK